MKYHTRECLDRYQAYLSCNCSVGWLASLVDPIFTPHGPACPVHGEMLIRRDDWAGWTCPDIRVCHVGITDESVYLLSRRRIVWQVTPVL